jgi:hypothetical protein
MINDVIRESLASANRAIGVANLESLFRANRFAFPCQVAGLRVPFVPC